MQEQLVTFKREIFNEAYLPYLESNCRIEFFYGGGGSGKSVFVTQRDIMRFLGIPGCNILAMRKIAASHHNTTFAEYCEFLFKKKLDHLVRINASKGDERIICQNGNEIIFGGCKDRKELEKLKGIKTRTGPIVKIRMEEMTDFVEYDFYQLNNVRLRGETKIPKQLTGTMNPVANGSWIKKNFFDKPAPGTEFFEHTNTDPEKLALAQISILKTTHIDNRFYGEDERKELLKLEEQDKYYYDVYVLGNWGVLGNLVFSNYIIEDFDYDETSLENVCNGLDFGFVHAQAIERMGFKDGDIYVFDELWAKGRTNDEFITDSQEYFGEKLDYMEMTADSANPDKIKEWNDKGYRVNPAKKGPGSLQFGIEFLVGKRIHIHASKCSNLAREIQGFKRKEDKDGNTKEDFVELNDDGIAALRYASEWIWSQSHADISDFSASDIGF
jgi:phage terminase large subunit